MDPKALVIKVNFLFYMEDGARKLSPFLVSRRISVVDYIYVADYCICPYETPCTFTNFGILSWSTVVEKAASVVKIDPCTISKIVSLRSMLGK